MKYDYIVIYSSRTGNTKKVASEIFAFLPGMHKDLKSIDEFRESQETDTYFVGFWTDKGTCNSEAVEFLAGLHGKNIALFGTCGMGESPEYRKEIIDNAVSLIPRDNHFLGAFLCQGKMPIEVRRRFEELYSISDNKEGIAKLLHNYDRALFHPNNEDYDRVRLFTSAILDELNVPREISQNGIY